MLEDSYMLSGNALIVESKIITARGTLRQAIIMDKIIIKYVLLASPVPSLSLPAAFVARN